MSNQPTTSNLINDAPVLDTVFDTLPSGLMLLYNSGQILRINQRGRELLGLDNDTSLSDVTDFPHYLKPLGELLINSSEDIQRSEIGLKLPSKSQEDESTIGFSLKTILADPKSRLLAFTFTDITQVLKDRLAMDKIKDELSQSRKLASIGTMISGVAHELNNPLTGISMSAELTRMTLERLNKSLQKQATETETCQKLDKALSEVNKISKACQKAAALVGDLLSYSKPTKLDTVATSYQELVEETMAAMRSHPQFSKFKMTLKAPKQDYIVQADRVKIEQVFYNLFKNACDAAPEHEGELTVFFEEELSPDDIPYVVAHVKDKGPGIDKTVLSRIFDPFFSTKGNKGVGLGLSISYRTVEQHGGLLSVDSEVGKWTEFKVALPIYNEEYT